MKKLLGILGALGLTTSTAATVVSCTPAQADIDLSVNHAIGNDIDKTNAKNTGDDASKHYGFTNFFTLGDSLSDQNGITTLIKNKLSISIEMGGEYKNGFSNGPTTAALINNKLNFNDEEFSAANIAQKDAPISKGEEKVWGKNYSVGGATAMTQSGVSAAFINDSRIDLQAQALIQQQVVGANDLVMLEIGGNDLFAMIDNMNNPSKQVTIMNEALANIQKAVYTLLNNGVKNIVFLTPPDLTIVPRYVNAGEEILNFVDKIGHEFNKKIIAILDEANKANDNNIYIYDLFTEFKTVIEKFKVVSENKVVDKEFASSNAFDLSKIDISDIQNFKLEATKLEENSDKNIEDFFFIDQVHPTKAGHEFFSEIFFKALQEHYDFKEVK